MIDNGVALHQGHRHRSTSPHRQVTATRRRARSSSSWSRYDIDDDARPQGTPTTWVRRVPRRNRGERRCPRSTAGGSSSPPGSRPAQARPLRRARWSAARRPSSISSVCPNCTGQLQYRKGNHGRIRSLAMRRASTKFTVRTAKLAPGRYRIRVADPQPPDRPCPHAPAWRTLVISKHRKGTR